jgi:hypothetical protein
VRRCLLAVRRLLALRGLLAPTYTTHDTQPHTLSVTGAPNPSSAGMGTSLGRRRLRVGLLGRLLLAPTALRNGGLPSGGLTAPARGLAGRRARGRRVARAVAAHRSSSTGVVVVAARDDMGCCVCVVCVLGTTMTREGVKGPARGVAYVVTVVCSV